MSGDKSIFSYLYESYQDFTKFSDINANKKRSLLLDRDEYDIEIEQKLINNEKDELRKKVEYVVEDREVVSRLLKDERDSLKLEKKAIREQHK